MFRKKMFTQRDIDSLNSMEIGEVRKIKGLLFIKQQTAPGTMDCMNCCLSYHLNGIKGGKTRCSALRRVSTAFHCAGVHWQLVDDIIGG